MEGRDIAGRAGPLDPIRVGLVDDHPTVLAGVGEAVARTRDLVLAGTARTFDEGAELAGRVDVLVCDLLLAGGAEGLQLLDVVHHRPAPPAVIVLSAFGQASLVRAAIDRGAAGYLEKGAEVDAVLDAIRTVAAGGTAFSAAQLQAARAARRRPSDRELQVVALVADGATNAEIAGVLGLTEKTVESHLRRLFDRYGLLSRTELAVLAIEEGWVVPGARRG
jgi:DNA-binding NarL/FixJ family response regulator